jgi:hypothetical protein
MTGPALQAAVARVERLVTAWRDAPDLVAATMALGFDRQTCEDGLAAELDAWTADALEAVWRRDLGDSADLERAPRGVLVIAARTLPVSAMRQLLWARALGAEVTLKPASGQEALGRALTLGCDGPREGLTCLTPEPAAREAVIASAVGSHDAIVVLGADDTVTRLAALVDPRQAFVGYGHRVSAALVTARPTPRELSGLARDLTAWDQTGCLSPRVLWVTGADSLTGLVGELAEALAEATRQLGPLPADAAHAQHTAWVRAVMTAQPVRRVGSWVLATPRAIDDTGPTPLPRWLDICPLAPDRLAAAMPSLSTLGLGAGVPRALIAPTPPWLRVCDLGEMQRPPLDWLQDGQAPLRALLRPA